MTGQRLIIADSETTGLKNPRPVEIAWVECDDNLNIIHRVESLIDPECAIEPGASAVHGIYYKDVAEAPTMREFFTYVQDNPFGYGDVVFVAHNAKFDLPMFKPYIANHDGTVCTLKLARRLYKEAPNHKLQTLREFLGLEYGAAHRALGDVITTHALLKRVMIDFDLSLEEIIELHNTPTFVKVMPFGKHKGTPLQELPASYKSWLMSLDDLDDNLRYSLNLVANS